MRSQAVHSSYPPVMVGPVRTSSQAKLHLAGWRSVVSSEGYPGGEPL